MNESVADKYNTVLGPVEAVRVTEENMEDVAKWCLGKVIKYDPLDAPEQLIYIKLKTHDRHGRVVEDTANIGEWVVVDDDGDGRFTVYADKLFLKTIFDGDKIAKLVSEAMEFQDYVTRRGGTVEETSETAEFVAMQIAKLYR